MKKRRILIIDDIQSVRNALRGYLCPTISAPDLMMQLISKGTLDPSPRYQIDEAGQGAQGVEMARTAYNEGHPYDIAFIDMVMPPGIDGTETIRRLREFDTDITIIVCTGLSEYTAQDLSIPNGGVVPMMLQKPLTTESNLISIVDAIKIRINK